MLVAERTAAADNWHTDTAIVSNIEPQASAAAVRLTSAAGAPAVNNFDLSALSAQQVKNSHSILQQQPSASAVFSITSQVEELEQLFSHRTKLVVAADDKAQAPVATTAAAAAAAADKSGTAQPQAQQYEQLALGRCPLLLPGVWQSGAAGKASLTLASHSAASLQEWDKWSVWL
jgi:glycerol-3-phosphate dehydrogenase